MESFPCIQRDREVPLRDSHSTFFVVCRYFSVQPANAPRITFLQCRELSREALDLFPVPDCLAAWFRAWVAGLHMRCPFRIGPTQRAPRRRPTRCDARDSIPRHRPVSRSPTKFTHEPVPRRCHHIVGYSCASHNIAPHCVASRPIRERSRNNPLDETSRPDQPRRLVRAEPRFPRKLLLRHPGAPALIRNPKRHVADRSTLGRIDI